MSDEQCVRLSADPLAMMEAIENIPPGGRAFITFDDIRTLTGHGVAQFIADHHKTMGTRQPISLELNKEEQRLYYVRANTRADILIG